MSGFLRLRASLTGLPPAPVWPQGTYRMPLAEAGPRDLHDLLVLAYCDGGGSVPPFETWWTGLVEDDEFHPELVIIAADANDRPIGIAQCWTSGFIKDLAVAPAWRHRGIGAALLRTALAVFAAEGLTQVDLKVEADNIAAQRFYRRMGMVEATD
ncbi:GNAT family N-acetyltransferase [Devosia sp. 1566]|uniref:GNAT family N-acetyltransferase n=1 Tax=Devosia sp. 1566 TaxID=2499144 RepID=UPI000FD820EA|nr:GNAT family N-acetyltransferase [Devosia sp. 1566]